MHLTLEIPDDHAEVILDALIQFCDDRIEAELTAYVRAPLDARALHAESVAAWTDVLGQFDAQKPA